ncbi:MAG: ATP-dependent zinc metalloprotease FtsH [Spirochaetales bacterium]|nr:ATP-dependent zinc metalloprotease FtsH [Spirochaetales bacterium]
MDNKTDNKNGENKQPHNNSFMHKLKPYRFIIFITLIFLIPWIFTFVIQLGQTGQIDYSVFLRELDKGNIESINIKGEEISGKFKNPVEEGTSYFKTYVPYYINESTLSTLKDNNVAITTQPSGGPSLFGIILNLLPFAIIFWIFFRASKTMREQGQSIFQVGKSKAKLYKREKTKTTFGDIAGLEGVIAELQEVVDFLKNPSKYSKLGAKSPKGVLLVGPPGTGKTLIARAVASESNVPFFSISGSDFVEMFVGVGASRVRDLFNEAKKAAPSIIFIDELDSIGRRRGTGLGGGHDEREQTLNQMLSEIDGFEKDEKTIILAATNRPDVLDPALLRPGRFDRRVTVGLPALKDREAILKIHIKNKPAGSDINLRAVAQSTPGFSGADLENLLNEGALIAARKNKHKIEQSDLNEAKDKIVLGLERKSIILTEEERRMVAYHEAGHALVAELLPETEPVYKVSIIPRDFSMGVTQQMQEGDKYLLKKSYILQRISVLMGGRAAEDVKLHTMTSGAENDLKEAQKLVRKMILDWGMGEKFSNISFGSQRQQVFLGEEIAHRRDFSEESNKLIDEEIIQILSQCYERSVLIIKEHASQLDSIVDRLLAKEEIQGEEIKNIIGTS